MNIFDDSNETPLMIACQKGYADITRSLLHFRRFFLNLLLLNRSVRNHVQDQHQSEKLDPDPSFHFDADLAFHSDTDLDPASQNNADPDPQQCPLVSEFFWP